MGRIFVIGGLLAAAYLVLADSSSPGFRTSGGGAVKSYTGASSGAISGVKSAASGIMN